MEPRNVNNLRSDSCGSMDVRQSASRVLDGLMGLFRDFKVFRCRACRHRFRAYVSVLIRRES